METSTDDDPQRFGEYRLAGRLGARGEVAAAVCARAGRPLSAAEWACHLIGVPYRAICP
ncbi:hypothetical protein [Nonomuraea turkmeniaca]|uniref:hypothetical protein n=1 Tax=Nonomuraea turkmeniaca TaxID=103838 RepID=UPI0014768B4B|nr:hypothetical protein [Nonomuraea turkmeniaca]